LNTKEDILKNVIEKLMVAIVFSPHFERQCAINCLGINDLQNIFFCVQQKKETRSGLGQLKGDKVMTTFSF